MVTILVSLVSAIAMPQPSPKTRKHQSPTSTLPTWADETELVGLEFELEAQHPGSLYAQYTIGLHAWFLDQVRQTNPELSATLHDEQNEKAFTISGLEGLQAQSKQFQLHAGQTYRWTITALSKPMTQWLQQWLQQVPPVLELRNAPLAIRQVAIALPPTTYNQLWEADYSEESAIALSFTSATSFRRKGQHFPLPLPVNVFHSYLRRWNMFSEWVFEPEEFLDWVEDTLLIQRYRLESTRVAAGKKGTVTAFTGAIEYVLSAKATADEEFEQLLFTLAHLAPYCGTGHKATFGLGQTRLGWSLPEVQATPSMQTLLTERIAELTALFIGQRKRIGGDRTLEVAETWATILARREFGESLQEIAEDLEMSYETVKSYAKRARQQVRDVENGSEPEQR